MMRRYTVASLAILGMCLVTAPGGEIWAQTGLDGALQKPPEDGGPRRFEVTSATIQLRAKPSSGAEVVGEFSKAAVLSNRGCETRQNALWCKVRPLRGGPVGFLEAVHLQVATGPDGVVAMGPDTSKRRVRSRDFDAETEISCAQEQGESLGTCTASIARSGGGDATVLVTFPNGFARRLFFAHGEFIRASATMSGVGTDIDWSLDGGRYRLRVDDQVFEVPLSFILGDE